MGNYFGIYSHSGMHGAYRITRESELDASPATRRRILMADSASISPEEWERIFCYYGSVAPDDVMAGVEMPRVSGELAYFRARGTKHPALAGKRPLTSCVAILPERGEIAFASVDSPDLRFADQGLQLDAARDVKGIAVDLQTVADGSLIITVIGTLKPTERHDGSLMRLAPGAEQPLALADGLHRPVAASPFDANGDQLIDFLICEFGHHTGELSWLETRADGAHQKHTILDKPNAIAAIPQDADADGDTDIYALFAGGREGIWLFTNDGVGGFAGKELIAFPAATGSVSLRLVDIDGDGDQDLLHVAGDNDDSSPILKPYHGLRLFLNDGAGTFALAQFYRMHGAYQVEAADFDLDGDLDIALCSQFGDATNLADQAFVLLENGGDLGFAPRSHPATYGIRWMRMDAEDFDGDGDVDIVLGAMIPRHKDWLQPAGEILKRWQDAPEVLLLENLTK